MLCLILALTLGASPILPVMAAEEKTASVCAYQGHHHSGDCYDGDGNLTCGYADFVVHTHDENCRDSEGTWICTLPEIMEHRHDSSCYESRKALVCREPESDGHVHCDGCFTLVQGELICDNTEEDHQHTDECYSWEKKLTCGKKEGEGSHHHGDACYETQQVLVCGKKEVVLHTHTDDCYTPILDESGNTTGRKLTCGLLQVERHQHGADCLKEEIPGQTTDATEETAAGTTEATTEATGETAQGAEAVAALIAGLPEPEEIAEALASFADGENPEGYEAYLAEITARVREVHTAYMALTGEEQETVENREKLLSLWEALGLEGETLEESTDEPATATGGFPGYVQKVTIDKIEDGTAKFDLTVGDGNDKDGNNKIVRTFDTVRYDMVATLASRDGASNRQKADLCFAIEMDKGITQAKFDTASMSWLHARYADWQVEFYRDGENTPVLLGKLQGNDYKLYAKDSSGDFTVETSINALVYGSEGGSDGASQAYRMRENEIVRQKLVGTVTLTDANNVLAGTQGLYTIIQILNDQNGAEIAPRFQAYYQQNPDNFGKYTDVDGTKTSSRETGNAIDLSRSEGGGYPVTITCAPLFNTTLRNVSINYLSWYDFSTGNEVEKGALLNYLRMAGGLAENQGKLDPSLYTQDGDANVKAAYDALTEAEKKRLASIRYGRMDGLGITLNIGSSDPDKGYKGCSLPVGELTFDLRLDLNATDNQGKPLSDTFGAVLWDYSANVTWYGTYQKYEDKAQGHIRTPRQKPYSGTLDRNLRWDNIGSSSYAARGAPTSYLGELKREEWVYDSGEWALTGVNGKSATTSTMNDRNSVYTFTVNKYDFDLNEYDFPLAVMYHTSTAGTNGLSTVGDYSFFGGYSQVLYVMPYTSNGTVQMTSRHTLGNLEVMDTAGQKLDLGAGAERGKAVTPENESNKNDNVRTGAVAAYAGGTFTKRNSFNGADSPLHETKFLGTSFWDNSKNWDENTYAGTDIAILGSAQLTSDSDNKIRAVNLLQLFDSHALSITPKDKSQKAVLMQGDVDFHVQYSFKYEGHDPRETFLFAADPAFPEGYDTNAERVVDYMNKVKEASLIYADKLYWNEKEQRYNIVKYDCDRDGQLEEYICVGVLAEIRNCYYKDYASCRFPVTVADDPYYLGKTVGTLNGATAWIREGAMAGISWKDGQWDPATRKNTLEGYEEIQNARYPGGNGYFLWNGSSGSISFRKVEYDGDGKYVVGTTGKTPGASLLILQYEANVHVTDQKTAAGDRPYYSLDNNERMVTWTLNTINTKVKTAQGTKEEHRTDLTIPVSLRYGGMKEEGTQQQDLFFIPKDRYTVTALDENGNPKTFSIPTDSENPVQVWFQGQYKDENGNIQTKLYDYWIYAELGTNEADLVFRLSDVPVGQALPDIQFQTYLGNALKDNDKIEAIARISGTGDKRAYSTANGNESTDTINISATTTTFLSKRVDKHYGELDTEITYTITYTNSSDTPIMESYFYDMLPYSGDTRGSRYAGDRRLTGGSYDVRETNTGTSAENSPTRVTVYGSTMDSATLRQELYDFTNLPNTGDRNQQIAELLENFFHEINEETDWIGVNGIVVKVEDMPGHRDLVLTVPMKTSGNQAGDTYLNAAWHWDAQSEALPLQSNIVQTRIIAREISGLVWHDRNLDGKRDSREPLIPGVTVSLFQKAGDGSYVPCTEDIRGNAVTPKTTGTDGSYRFGALPEGEYIVAFSGEALEAYVSETVYQSTRADTAWNSDGVEKLAGIQLKDNGQDVTGNYAYFIQYGKESAAMKLHSLADIAGGTVSLNNGVEAYPHLDLGLVITGPEMPKSGGEGTMLFTVSGLALVTLAGALLTVRRRKTHDGK